MANLIEASTFDAGVYQIEVLDPVQGGPTGLTNTPLKNLTNRTRFLKDAYDSLLTSVGLKAPLASPGLTGTPTAPTPAAGNIDTGLATTAFVERAVNGLVVVNVAGNLNVVLTPAQFGVSIIFFVGTLTGNINVIFPARYGQWLAFNATGGATAGGVPFTINCKTAAQADGTLIKQSHRKSISCDQSGVFASMTDFEDVLNAFGPGGALQVLRRNLANNTLEYAPERGVEARRVLTTSAPLGYIPADGVKPSGATFSAQPNRLYALRLSTPNSFRTFCFQSVIFAGPGRAYVAVYSAAPGSGAPSVRERVIGPVSVVDGINVIDLGSQYEPTGLIWLVALFDVAVPLVGAAPNELAYQIYGVTTPGENARFCGQTTDHLFANGMPATYPAGAAFMDGAGPMFLVRQSL